MYCEKYGQQVSYVSLRQAVHVLHYFYLLEPVGKREAAIINIRFLSSLYHKSVYVTETFFGENDDVVRSGPANRCILFSISLLQLTACTCLRDGYCRVSVEAKAPLFASTTN